MKTRAIFRKTMLLIAPVGLVLGLTAPTAAQSLVSPDQQLMTGASEPFFTGAQYMWGLAAWFPFDPRDKAADAVFDWGDGTPTTTMAIDWNNNCNTGLEDPWFCSAWAPHTYAQQGDWTITVTMRQEDADSGSVSGEYLVYELSTGGTVKGSGMLWARDGGMYQQNYGGGPAYFMLDAKRRAGTGTTSAKLTVRVPNMVADWNGATGMTFTSLAPTRPLYVQRLSTTKYDVMLERVFGSVTNSAGPAGHAYATVHVIVEKGKPTLMRIGVWNTSAGYTYVTTAYEPTYLSLNAYYDLLLTGKVQVR